MAKTEDFKRRPRVRKSAPTIRQRVEAASAAEEAKKPRRIRRVLTKTISPVKKLKVKERRIFKPVVRLLRLLKNVLRWIVPSYFINSWRELRLVNWPNRRETLRLTLAVFIFALVFGTLVAGVDWVLQEVFKKVILK